MLSKSKKVYGHLLIDIWDRLPGDGFTKKDICDNTIVFNDYGNYKVTTGWHVDHIIPQSKGGSNYLTNLQPLQHAANCSKSNKYDFLNKKTHYLHLQKNPILGRRQRPKGIRFKVGHIYYVYQNSEVCEPQVATIVGVSKKRIQVKWANGYISSIYPDPILFEYLQVKQKRKL